MMENVSNTFDKLSMKEKKQHGGGLSTGFLLGVIVGVIVTLLLTTKRGKKILNIITKEGLHKLSDFEGVFDDMVEEYQSQPESEKPKKKTGELLAQLEEDEETAEELVSKPKEEVKAKSESKPLKRFFKGIPRRIIN